MFLATHGVIRNNSGGGYTARTTAFATATAITDTTILNALNTFDLGLISNGLDTKMKAIYPFVGTTSTTQKFNFMDARDLDVAFRLQFNGGWVFSSTGALPNGTNAYANTYLTPSTNGLIYNNNHLSFYSRTSNARDLFDMGSMTDANATDVLSLWARRTSDTAGYDSGNFAQNRLTATNIDAKGFYLNSANPSTSNIFKNGISLGSKALTASSISTVNVFVAAFNQGNSVTYYSDRECLFSSIGNGLTDTEATTFYNLVQTMQVSLSRAVYTARTTAFATATAITDTTILNALNTFDLGLISNGLDTKMKALYPFVGGTATTNKYNFMDARDLDVAFRLQFNGGWTYNSNGVIGSVNSYANTFLNANALAMSINSFHASYYNRTSINTANSPVLIGDYRNWRTYLQQTLTFIEGSAASAAYMTTSTASTNNFTMLNRNASNYQEIRRTNSILISNAGTATSFANVNFLLNSSDGTNEIYNGNCSFASIGTGMTNSEAITFYNLIQTLQTSLSRQI